MPVWGRLEEALREITVGHDHHDGHCIYRPDQSIASCKAVEIARQALSAAEQQEASPKFKGRVRFESTPDNPYRVE